MNFARLYKFLGWVFYNLAIVFLLFEVLLRTVPSLMPYGQTWNYIHHYLEISRFLQEPNRLTLDRYHIVALGDSFTRGAEVPPNSDWLAVLNNDYGQKIFNLGIGGASTVEELMILQSITLPPSIDTVVLGIFQNDIQANAVDLRRLKEEGPQPFLNRSNRVSDVANYEHCEAPWWTWIREWKCVYLYSYAVSTVTDIYRQFVLGDSYQQRVHDVSSYIYDSASRWYVPKALRLSGYESREAYARLYDEDIAITMALISVMKDYLAERRIRLMAVYFPAAQEVYAREFGQLLDQPVEHTSSLGTLLKPHMINLDIPFLDITDELRNVRLENAPLYRPFDQHFTESGHRTAARIIMRFIGKDSGAGIN